MRVPLSWVHDFVKVDIEPLELAHRLTLAGLEVTEVRFVGRAMPDSGGGSAAEGGQWRETMVTGLAWDPAKIVVGEIREVMPHPNADRLVLCRLYDGEVEHTVLTGAPNLFHLKGQGALEAALKVAYAKEGAELYDGHQPGWEIVRLKKAKIRGVESSSMVCSEKELGISEDHEGIIVLDPDAPVGESLADVMGDVVFEIDITPNIARDANILGVAREIAALYDVPLEEPDYEMTWRGPAIEGRLQIEIDVPELNPRFVAGLVEGVTIKPSPYWVQRRLKLAGMRPINNIVDCTNYVMLEVGEPLHAFDYDVLIERAGGAAPTIITRQASAGEQLTTLDDVERQLDEFTVLVTDTAGPLSIAGVMGGAESEVGPGTVNVLLEGAAWNFINIRRTLASQKLSSEAAYRFSRGVHPAMAERGVRRGLTLMHRLAGGEVAEGLVDRYPLPPASSKIETSPADVARWLGIEMDGEEMADVLKRLGFGVTVLDGGHLMVESPDHRLDIGEGVVGRADLMEEIARIYGYDHIPETLLEDPLPPQRRNAEAEQVERIRDLLVDLGLQELVTYRMTTPGAEARLVPGGGAAELSTYVQLANPITSEMTVMRRSLLASVLGVLERNHNLRQRLAVFEIGPVFLPEEGQSLPDEPLRLVVALTGSVAGRDWADGEGSAEMEFFYLKGLLQALFEALHLDGINFAPADRPSFHPGKCAEVQRDGMPLGWLGELHPLVAESYTLGEHPVLAAELDLQAILPVIPERFRVEPVPAYPPVLEDLALVVDQNIPAGQVAASISRLGGDLVVGVKLFDVYQGDQIGSGKRSLAYSVVYQAPDHTLTDDEVASVRKAIVDGLQDELGAVLRS
jgi:phenylalanyl-tRNA synthetase beta chain